MTLSQLAPHLSVRFWLEWMAEQPAFLGVLMAVAGALCLFYGWQISRIALAFSGALLGVVTASVVHETTPIDTSILVVIAIVLTLGLGALAAAAPRIGASVLGGVLAFVATAALTSWVGLSYSISVVAGVVAALAVAPLAFAMFEHVVIFVTSFEGALLLVAGIAIMLNAQGHLFSSFRDVSLKNPVFVPLTLIAPTVIGFCLQLSGYYERSGKPTSG